MDRTYIPVNSIVDVPYGGEWVAGAAIKKGEFRTYGGLLFMANLAHIATADNAPYADPAVIYARQYRGTYSATVTYAKYDTVTSAEGNQYISLVEDNLGNTPPTDGTDSAYWACYARRGPQGIKGDPGGEVGNWAIQEVPAGTRNGVNKSFTLANTPIGPVSVKFNMLEYQNAIDYTNSGTTLTLISFAPNDADGDKFWVTYPY